jgi:hypothetical protein
MKGTPIIIVFLTVSLLFSCEEQGLFPNCNDCVLDEPSVAILEAKVDPFELTNFVTTIKIYEGNLEDSILVGTFETYSDRFSHSVKLNKKYTVTATYYSHGKYQVAVDSATPKVKYEKDLCETPCYFVYDRLLDLRIKYW